MPTFSRRGGRLFAGGDITPLFSCAVAEVISIASISTTTIELSCLQITSLHPSCSLRLFLISCYLSLSSGRSPRSRLANGPEARAPLADPWPARSEYAPYRLFHPPSHRCRALSLRSGHG